MTIKKLVPFLIFSILLAGCNPFGDSKDMELVEMKLGKTFNDSTEVLSDLTETFSLSDAEAVLWISWNHVKGDNKGVIEWHSEDGKLYQEDKFEFTAADDTWATWHRLPIALARAPLTAGDWVVYITLRGKYMGKKKFKITGTGSGPLQ